MTSLDAEHNPYAAPQAELQVQAIPSGPAVLYPMSPRKVAVMSVLTFSLYDRLFWYRHWTRIKESGHDVSPIARTIFAPLAAFSFLTMLTSLRYPRDLKSDSLLQMTPVIYFGVAVASRISDKFLDGIPGLVFMMLGAAASGWALATMQRGANEVLEADNYRGPSNSGASWGAILMGALGAALWLVAIVGAVSPDTLDLE